jgi:hypothetical protein
MLTPAIREFLVRLEDLVDARSWPDLDRDAMTVTTAHSNALVRLPHSTNHARDVELEVGERTVVVRYAPDEISFTSRDEALRFIEMLGDARVELIVRRNLGWTTMESYRDGIARPFRRVRMPWPTLRPRVERKPFGFA